MQLSTFIQILASAFGIIGSLFFAIGVIRQSAEAMAQLSETYYDVNPHMAPALAAQKADYIFGGVIIVMAFAVQLISFLVPANFLIFGEASAKWIPWIVLALTPIIFFLLRAAAKRLANRYERQINQALDDGEQMRTWQRDAERAANS